MNKLLFATGILSAALIAFQLSLIQVLSIVQWYHFAYMVISVALLGFGAAASVLAITRKKIIAHAGILIPWIMVITGVTMSLVTGISQHPFIRFDSYLLFAENRQASNLILSYFLFFIPFFSGALALGLIFIKNAGKIGVIYFANLVGSGVGGIIALVLTGIYFPNQLPAVIAILPVIAGIILLLPVKGFLKIGSIILAAGIVVWKLIVPPQLVLSQYKDLSKAMLLPGATITSEIASPYGVLQTVSSPVLRYAPGMSLASGGTAQVKLAAFINGDWFGSVTNWKRSDTSIILDYTTFALPYVMAKRQDVLLLRSGTGMEVAHALKHGARKIVAIEPNVVVTSTLMNIFPVETDSLYQHPAVTLYNLEPRTFLLMDTSRYDLIALPMIGTFGGSAGLYALQEQFFLTKESFRESWMKLKPGGALTATSWMDYPVRNPLKILSTMVSVLRDEGIKNPAEYITAVRSWGTITFTMNRSPVKQDEINNTRTFCEQMMFDPAILTGLQPGERTAFNQLQDSSFFNYLDIILSGDNDQLLKDYDFNIQPATDNKPYFSQFIKIWHFKRLADFFGDRSLPFFEIGYVIVIVTFVQISIVSILLVILPLFRIGWRVKKFSIILYFTGIGLGFMFVEMIFIQRFILYFGNPVYSVCAVITSLLVSSGIGSYTSGYFSDKKRTVIIFAAIVGLLLLYSLFFTEVLLQTIHLNLFFKVLVLITLISPLGFCMGIPFPLGIARVSKINPDVVPWAWGINGCVSVISTALATIVSVEMGFSWVMLMAAFAYCLPLVAQLAIK